MRWTGHVACMGEKRNSYKLLSKQEGKRLLGRSRSGRKIILTSIFEKQAERA
jgi:hypothetical protein